MKPLVVAQRQVVDAIATLPSSARPLDTCFGLALAADVTARHDIPPFDNSGMDGFAVRSGDLIDPPAVLRVLEDVPAGSVPTATVEPGTAVRIMTGAPVPEGADGIAIVEDSEDLGDGSVRLAARVAPGDHIRPAGGDVRTGDVVLEAGTRLGSVQLGMLASVGVAEPEVVRSPVVAIMSTGDELTPVDAPDLAPGSIRDSNRPTLHAALRDLGVEVLDLGIVPDDARLLRAALGEAAESADAVVTSGGVSMGDYDLIKQMLGELGSVDFWRVAMQPAKPFAFGSLGETPFFGLPGNPVSVFVAFEQFVRPALLRQMGATHLFRPRVPAVAGVHMKTNPEKTVFLRVAISRREDLLEVTPAGAQGSNVLSALAAADALAVVPVGTGDVAPGDHVELEWFRAQEARTYQDVLGE